VAIAVPGRRGPNQSARHSPEKGFPISCSSQEEFARLAVPQLWRVLSELNDVSESGASKITRYHLILANL